jgi:hypothetical protein
VPLRPVVLLSAAGLLYDRTVIQRLADRQCHLDLEHHLRIRQSLGLARAILPASDSHCLALVALGLSADEIL